MMKKFNIKNIRGFEFQLEGESLEKLYGEKLPPEWGKPAYKNLKNNKGQNNEI